MGLLDMLGGGGNQSGMDDAIAYAQKIYADTQKNVAPYITSGQGVLPAMTNIATNLQESPLYKWQLGQETGMANKALAARGLSNSGAGLKYLSDITNRLTAQEGGNMWNRMATLAGYGLQGSQIQGGVGTSTANTMSKLAQAEGQQQLMSNQMGLQALQGMVGMGAGLYSGSQYTSALNAIAKGQGAGSLSNPALTDTNLMAG
jgi:hypothetical protein